MFSKRKYELRERDIHESFRYLRKYSRADCKETGIGKRCPLYSTIAVTFRKVKLLGNKGWRLEKMANVSTPGGFSTPYNRGILCLFGHEW